MTTLTLFASRPYAGEADLQAVCDLINACDAVDQFDDNYDVNNLRLELEHPDLDPARDLRVWAGTSGELIGFGRIWRPREPGEEGLDGFINISVLPAARGNGLEDEILRWGEERLGQVGRER